MLRANSLATQTWLRVRRGLLGLLLIPCAATMGVEVALAEDHVPAFRVVVHPSNTRRAAERAFLADAFLKKTTRWENGNAIRPVDLRPSATARKLFSERVLKRTVGAVRSYWQQRIFSGRDLPPPELDGDEDVLVFVSKHPGGVGYVSGTTKLRGVRELLVE